MSDEPSQVAPGVHRLGNWLVNYYLIEDGNRMTLVDGGLPGFRRSSNEYLRSRGRSVSDIDAVLLTHGALRPRRVRRDAFAPTRRRAGPRPRSDAEMARTGKVHKRDGSLVPYLRRPATWRLFLVGGKLGAARTPNVEEVTTFSEPVDLDVPGRPRIVPTPGHSPGHVCFHLPDRGVLLAGDALCTYNVADRQARPAGAAPVRSPTTRPQMLASLDAVERIDAGVLLPGHGEPWTDGPGGGRRAGA